MATAGLLSVAQRIFGFTIMDGAVYGTGRSVDVGATHLL